MHEMAVLAVPRRISNTCRPDVTGKETTMSTQRTWLRTRRLFYIDPSENPRSGWYIKARGARTFGPFPSRTEADKVLMHMLSTYTANEDSSR